MKNGIIISFSRYRRPVWKRDEWHILPYIQLVYHSDHFLETGVYTKAIILSYGWFNRQWTLTIQCGY
jgi:hypothetical protein